MGAGRRVLERTPGRGWVLLLAGAVLPAGCPTTGLPPQEFILGGAAQDVTLGARASVSVLAPIGDLQIVGGTPVEVTFRVVATTRFASVDVIFDPDQDPENGNEIFAQTGLALSTNSVVLDTSRLRAGAYFVGVILREVGQIAAFGYASGQVIVNQRPELVFDSPRANIVLDRTQRIARRFDVSWRVLDPDSTIRVEIFLDPDSTPNGNEVLLRRSDSQSGDSFSFDLPTANFPAGVYRLLAVVSDGVNTFPFYAPGTIRLRSRLAGFVDLRDLDLPTAAVRGAIFEGFNPRDNAGSFVSSARDIDGDGFDDFVIVAQFGKPQYQFNIQRTGVGEAYLIYGRRDRFSGRVNLNSAGTLFRGEVYGGPFEQPDPIRPSRGITSFTVLSDWDGDGVREFAWGLPFIDSLSVFFSGAEFSAGAPLDANGYFRSGAVVVTAGSSLRPDLGFPGRNVFNLALFGTLAHNTCPPTPANCPEGFYGKKAASIIGQPEEGGGVTLFHRHLACDPRGAPNPGSVRLGCRISSNEFGDQFGEVVSAYDFDSIIISVPNRDPAISAITNPVGSIPGAGTVSIFFNNSIDGFYPWENLNAPPAADSYPGTPANPANNFIPHTGPYHYIMDDYQLFRGPAGRGGFFGSPGYAVDPEDGEPCVLTFAVDAFTNQRTTRIFGGFIGGRLGNAVSIEDFNADGLRDFLVGSPLSNEGRGACFIVLGRIRELVMNGELPIEELSLPMEGSNPRIFDGIRVIGAPGARLGESQDSAGDFNGDGLPDVIIGSPLVNNRQGGAAIFFGSREVINLTQGEIPYEELPTRGLGVILVGEAEGDLAGARVRGAGDIDGDGLDDVLIAAPNRSVRLDIDLDGTIEIDRTNCGVVYLVYGSPDLRGTVRLADVGTEQVPGAVFIGRLTDDQLGAGLGELGDRANGIGAAGDVDGDGRRDLLLGSVRASPRDRSRAGEAYLIYGVGD